MSDIPTRLTTALADRYRIEDELGQGGMATVYLAEDLKHKRRVAVKVLRPELAAVLGAERFVQEITTTAALQHPHILPLFDSGEAGGFLYYVMPFIDGETLRSKLDRETQLGIEEAVRIATAVADALDYAHRQGVIHRDIKPENILLHDGRPMVADFGIALAVSAAAGGRMTETGLSLGTPHYMSPEQATAEKELSGRSDIYSLASVLYEMLTGSPPHVGASAQQIIMKIVTEEAAPVTRLRKAVPPNVAAAVARALEKLPADRFESARAFAEALHANAPVGMAGAPGRLPHSSVVARSSWLGWGVGVAGLAFAAWSLLGTSRRPEPPTPLRTLSLVLPDSAPLAFIGEGTLGGGQRALVLTPDGRTLVYAARAGGIDGLYRRDLASDIAVPIAGTAGAYHPFVSPNGDWIGFFVGTELRKVPLGGGPVIALATVPEPMGAAWGQDGRILVAGREGGLLGWVPESGGALAEIPNPQGVGRQAPSFLPDGRHAVVELWGATPLNRLGVVELDGGRTVALTAAGPVPADSVGELAAFRGSQPQFLRSGHLLYATPTGVVAVAFDPATHRVRGRTLEVLSDVRRDFGIQYTVGRDGTLVYAPGVDANTGVLAWVTPGAPPEPLGFAPQRYGTFDLSPDGTRIAALVVGSGGTTDLWVYDLGRRTESKVRTRGIPSMPRWWPDGERLVFTETATEAPFRRAVVRQLVESSGDRDTLASDWEFNDIAPDSVRAAGVIYGRGVWSVPLDAGVAPIPLDSFPNAWGPAFAPAGSRVAYTSNESGRYEIYVTDVDRRGEHRQVSLAGGEEPVWSPSGDELFYRWGQTWYAVAVPAGGAPTSFGRPRAIFQGPYVNVFERSYDVAPQGPPRFLVVLGPREQVAAHLRVITGWLDDVIRRLGQ